jgi:hypothetical protein
MTTFKPAAREQTSILLGLSAQSGGGKTFSGLTVASGMSDRIAFIDTERGRALHYAETFRFDHALLEPPFTPERYLEMIVTAEDHVGEGGVVIVDSMSHEHEGVGGLLEIAASIQDKMAESAKKRGQHWATSEQFTFPSWREPKQRHQRMVNRLLQLRCHLIVCFRAKEKFKIVETDGRGKKGKEIVSQGIIAICDDNLPYEMTALATLYPSEPGVPHFAQKALMSGLQHLFPEGKRLSKEHGRRLAEWAKGGAPRREHAQDPDHDMKTGEVYEPTPDGHAKRKTLPLFYNGAEIEEHVSGNEWLDALRRSWTNDRRRTADPANLALLRKLAPKIPDAGEREAMERLALDMTEDLSAAGQETAA